jgi:hypothetical protein
VVSLVLFVGVYGCETWSLTLREEHRLRVFENRTLRRKFGLQEDQVTGDWRKLQNEELHNLYSSPSIIGMIKSRRMGWTRHAARMEKKNAFRILMGNPESEGPTDGQDVGGWTIIKWISER